MIATSTSTPELFQLPSSFPAAPIDGQNLGGAGTWGELLHDELGGVPTLLVLVRHFG